MSRYDFLVETYKTERIKTLSAWSQFSDEDMEFRRKDELELLTSTWCISV